LELEVPAMGPGVQEVQEVQGVLDLVQEVPDLVQEVLDLEQEVLVLL